MCLGISIGEACNPIDIVDDGRMQSFSLQFCYATLGCCYSAAERILRDFQFDDVEFWRRSFDQCNHSMNAILCGVGAVLSALRRVNA